ncbi:hypothetical protein DMB95_00040 [Campylobacter sp. MIT 12-8780]|uniref:hypothetical protein n=1 Tax=unclassified Campylobacter TaxID=2593542 RepID=UPI00115D0E13|nr:MULTISPECIES: hypothetical protein [unclassified Campylobacter]NDJ26348.1 hypothetical protein [Campylobacter sp. MIT 19-121]TQR42926.1 hypothetical protein DMB95_00040 [Campylobacter sp. MIT 12-8780]
MAILNKSKPIDKIFCRLKAVDKVMFNGAQIYPVGENIGGLDYELVSDEKAQKWQLVLAQDRALNFPTWGRILPVINNQVYIALAKEGDSDTVRQGSKKLIFVNSKKTPLEYLSFTQANYAPQSSSAVGFVAHLLNEIEKFKDEEYFIVQLEWMNKYNANAYYDASNLAGYLLAIGYSYFLANAINGAFKVSFQIIGKKKGMADIRINEFLTVPVTPVRSHNGITLCSAKNQIEFFANATQSSPEYTADYLTYFQTQIATTPDDLGVGWKVDLIAKTNERMGYDLVRAGGNALLMNLSITTTATNYYNSNFVLRCDELYTEDDERLYPKKYSSVANALILVSLSKSMQKSFVLDANLQANFGSEEDDDYLISLECVCSSASQNNTYKFFDIYTQDSGYNFKARVKGTTVYRSGSATIRLVKYAAKNKALKLHKNHYVFRNGTENGVGVDRMSLAQTKSTGAVISANLQFMNKASGGDGGKLINMADYDTRV